MISPKDCAECERYRTDIESCVLSVYCGNAAIERASVMPPCLVIRVEVSLIA